MGYLLASIDWQQLRKNVEQNASINDFKPFQVGVYRSLDSILLNDMIEPLDGLIVDTRNGGIAFRNHTGPIDIKLGAEW